MTSPKKANDLGESLKEVIRVRVDAACKAEQLDDNSPIPVVQAALDRVAAEVNETLVDSPLKGIILTYHGKGDIEIDIKARRESENDARAK